MSRIKSNKKRSIVDSDEYVALKRSKTTEIQNKTCKILEKQLVESTNLCRDCSIDSDSCCRFIGWRRYIC